jgi:hypothetical protein
MSLRSSRRCHYCLPFAAQGDDLRLGKQINSSYGDQQENERDDHDRARKFLSFPHWDGEQQEQERARRKARAAISMWASSV